MPLPKPPSKPAALLAAGDYPKATPGKVVKPVIALVETNQRPRTTGTTNTTEASATVFAAQPAAARH
jgi:PhoH-like ATPase